MVLEYITRDLFIVFVVHVHRWGNFLTCFWFRRRIQVGQEFAFVKFQDVRNITDMEKRLNEVKIDGLTLRANREKHPRKPAGIQSNVPPPARRWPPPLNQSRTTAGFCDGRTFLEASMGTTHRQVPQPSFQPPVVKLISKNSNWVDDRVLVGEVKDFETLENIQSLLGLEGFGDILCKYLGGLQPFSTYRYVESEDDDDGEEMGDDEDDDTDEEEEKMTSNKMESQLRLR
ncbi:hypothetical protein L1887_34861 [Cichorium endivia]|nr:hypothetical protein L1887_34861 [Cichorium endivia]